MKYRVASKEYIDNLKPGDKVWVKVESRFNSCARSGVFVGRTTTGRLSIQYKYNKDWLYNNGKRAIRIDNWTTEDNTLIQVIEE